MVRTYTRKDFLARLKAAIRSKKPLLMTSAGAGICAKFIERGGVDILGVYNTGYYRMQGYGSLAGMLPIADANKLVFDMGKHEILPQIKEVPVIAGLNGCDITRDMRLFIEECKTIGFSGVHNFPTIAFFEGSFRRTLEATGFTYQMEIEMLKAARELDMLGIGYAFNEEETERLIKEADVDIFIFHAGITRGGSTGYSKGRSLEDMAQRTQKMYDIAKRIKPDVILLAHGAALVSPEDAQYLLDHTDADGVQLGSSIERIAIEEPLQRRTEEFKRIKVR